MFKLGCIKRTQRKAHFRRTSTAGASKIFENLNVGPRRSGP